MPECITSKYPEIGSNGRYNINHPVAQVVEKAFVENVLSTISEYESLGSIIVANEPDYTSWDYLNISGASAKKIDYNEKFREYLLKKHGNIATLNAAWGTSHSDFSKINCPTTFAQTAAFYEWKNFNDELFANWYTKTVKIIKDCIPGIPVSLKVQPDLVAIDSESTREEHLTRGLDMELLGQLSDFHGNDSYGYYEESGTIRATMMWYDYLNSISEKPIYDSEKHITKNGSTKYDDDMTKYIKQSVWQSMVHGLDMYSIWTWNLSTSSSDGSYGHLALRPSAISEVAKSALDANRWSAEVTELANATPTVAILRSDASRIYNGRYMNAVTIAYNAANEAGHKVGFVSSKNIESKLSNYDTLIIPYTTNVETNVINAIAGFEGKIVILDSDSLKKNEYNKSYSGDMLTKVNQIIREADVTEVSGQAFNSYKISSPTVSDFKSKLVDNTGIMVSNNGSLQNNLEWHSVLYKNGYLVNISNYDTSSTRNVTITLDGEGFTYVTSLIDNEDVTSISLPKMTSGLYYVRDVEDDILEDEEDDGGEEVYGPNEILSLDATRSGNTNRLTWTSGNTGLYNIYSVNPDGTLKFITSTEDESYEDTSSEVKTYAVKCVVEDGESKGKKITCGFDVDSAITVTTVQSPTNKIIINYTNNEVHCVASTITATAYNSDGSFNKAVVVEMLVPSGKTVNYEKTLGGTGNVVITKK